MQNKILSIVCCLTFLACAHVNAQEQAEEDLYSLSLEELMNVPIHSASKKSETLFDAPLSSYTITRADIERSGAPSIMEALRLAPGLIVREQSNGVYDIHIRGMENLTRTNGHFMKPNILTLVMIDNRPVFNHGLGGTFWESLPVDINDVDRIEIVRGPSSPMFGPNAVTGVINIITRRMGDASTMVYANVQSGTLVPLVANASVGRKINDKLAFVITGNIQDRERYDDLYYRTADGTYGPLSSIVPDATIRNLKYPNPDQSLNKWGVNGYLNYKLAKNASIDLSLSHQASEIQRQFLGATFDHATTGASAANLAATVGGLKLRASYADGHNMDLKYATPHGEYDFVVADAIVEYDFKLGKRYTVTPGVSFQSATFDDTEYVNPSEGDIGYFNKKNGIETTAAFVRSDLNVTDKFRLLAAIRVDKFSAPDKAYLAYEMAATYKLNPENLIRFAVTRSNSGSFLGYNYLDIGGTIVGNDDLKIFTLNMIEFGYRIKATRYLQFDIDVFRQNADNMTAILQDNGRQQFFNIPATATQTGATVSVNFVPNDKIQFKPFVTIQSTETKDLPSVYLNPAFGDLIGMPVSYGDSKHLHTPAAFGGFYFNYSPLSRLNVNLSGYYFSKHTNYDQSYDSNDPDAKPAAYAEGQIEGKFLLNAKASYEAMKGLQVFVSGRNILGASSREFYGAEKTRALVLGGLTYKLN